MKSALLFIFIALSQFAYAADDLVNCRWENGSEIPKDTCEYFQKEAEVQKEDELDKADRIAIQEKCTKFKPRALSSAERVAIEGSVRSNLKDPDSAKFKWGKLISQGSFVEDYCGLVNAKNGYGGYTGFQPFYAMISKPNKGKVSVITINLDESAIETCVNSCY